MKYAFWGTPEFAAIILEKLIKAGLPPALVVCNPDRPAGRKKIVTPPPTKIIAQKNNIEVWQPEKLSDVDISKFRNFEFAVVAAYAKILPKEIIETPRLGTIGVHPSLLPKYRGATPIQSAILNGEKETGTTLFLLDEKVDHGEILRNEKLKIKNEDNYALLMRRLAELSANLLIETLPKFVSGEIRPRPQNDAEATYTKKFRAEAGYVPEEILRSAQNDGGIAAINIERRVRALNPEPGVYTIQNGKRVKLLEAELSDEKLRLKKIQLEGREAKKVLF